MTTKAELQDLLRFLSQDAKLPLKEAMGSIKALQASELVSIETISRSSAEDLSKVFQSAKSAKSVLTAAKRIQKKRSNPSSANDTRSPVKRQKTDPSEEIINPDSTAAEEPLLLPVCDKSITDLESIVLHTNRAPLVLAFAIVLLSYTYPHQPLSSRLSLAQAVVSANSRSKAVSLGLESGPSAEDEGWGQGQPRIKIMGREIRVLRRWGYEASLPDALSSNASTLKDQPIDTDSESQIQTRTSWTEVTVPLWGLDTEKLRDANKGKSAPGAAPTSALPIFTPQAARTYLLRSFATPEETKEPSTAKKLSAKEVTIQKENNTALLLRALDILFKSWKDILGRDELDRRAWSWYVAVRPDVETGQKGWGEKGKIELRRILDLRRQVPNTTQSSS